MELANYSKVVPDGGYFRGTCKECSILVCEISRSFECLSPSNFRTQGSFIHINSEKVFEHDLLSSDSVAKSARQKPFVF